MFKVIYIGGDRDGEVIAVLEDVGDAINLASDTFNAVISEDPEKDDGFFCCGVIDEENGELVEW